MNPARKMNPAASPIAIKLPRTSASRGKRERFYSVLVCIALLCAFCATSWLAWVHKSPTFDEPLHFVGAWMQTHCGDFRVNAEDPPLWKYYAVAGMDANSVKVDRTSYEWNSLLADFTNQGVYVKNVLFHTTENNATALIQSARGRMIFLGVALALLCASWAWRLAGPLAGVIAIAAFCLDPNFLAHAPLVKNDVPLTFVLAALAMAVWLVGERGTVLRCIAILLLPGIALTTKFSGVLAIPMLGIALLIRAMLPQPWRILRWTATNRKQKLTAAFALGTASLLVAWLIIWACYDFRFGASPDPGEQMSMTDVLLITNQKQNIAKHATEIEAKHMDEMPPEWLDEWRPDAPTRLVNWAFNHHLLPQAWLIGFQFTYATSRERTTFLMGQHSLTGWWYYFPLAMLFKTPLATLAAFAFSAVGGIWLMFRQRIQNWWPILAAAVFPIFYLGMALTTGLNLGVRHVLPLYPFIFVLIGVVAARMRRIAPQVTMSLTVIFILGLAAETFAAFPNFIPFFNTAVGGWRGGLNLLSDSNIDWGQELLDLSAWQKKHPDRQLYLAYYGFGDPRYYDIHYLNLDSGTPMDQIKPENKRNVYAISAVDLQGANSSLSADDKHTLEPFHSMQPTEVLGNCLYLYELP